MTVYVTKAVMCVSDEGYADDCVIVMMVVVMEFTTKAVMYVSDEGCGDGGSDRVRDESCDVC